MKTRKESFELLRGKGWTLQQIGDEYGISRERVRQILLGDAYRQSISGLKRHEPVDRECDACSKIFTSQSHNNRYCGDCSPILNLLQGRERTREAVRIRDKRTCQECGRKWLPYERRFDVHHLNGMCGKKSKEYDSINEMDGLITLCHKCHIGNHAREKIILMKKKTTEEKIEAMVVLTDAGFSQDKIAKLLNMTQVAVSKNLAKLKST